MENKHKFDPTVIFRDLSIHKRDCFIKLGLFMLSFFYYLYRYAACANDPSFGASRSLFVIAAQ